MVVAIIFSPTLVTFRKIRRFRGRWQHFLYLFLFGSGRKIREVVCDGVYVGYDGHRLFIPQEFVIQGVGAVAYIKGI